ncbi:uncharacterized protein M421DRAFT_95858 [Didymella exigua CBS 183.55]|uniref:Uncharacterized protein n=1 Tax=Didymella exigua CBS 183.55 TaxID=1150837 RepID=A0A6A5R8S2_9PLEO|nr:uncharacterized protein M421DRAFT_95858 [Didymella exigua CBS 183.55]KAF1923739.1 hypothetical protein M421DRAFT_95858 [Didymella exigua CBS 183.55]
MTHQRPCMKRADGSSSYFINDLISAANTNDRFKLLEDDAILPANLSNAIHPLFRQLEGDERLHLALQVASHFLLHDRLLEFFVPLLHGCVMHDPQSSKEYLCDPLVHASKAKQALLLSSVRQSLDCLADRLEISFVSQKQRVWARTIMDDSTLMDSCCCRAFQTRLSPKIELTEKFSQFYYAADGYATATRSGQFRHDFLFAVTLVHEVVHAVGVMRRGNLNEPHYRLNSPETEWGYAWENFMFGRIINPQDKTKAGTQILMCKVWADAKAANVNGGKEYSDVSMSWIAQWFRNETWNIARKQGPTAIALPTTHFKIQISHKLGAWIVRSDNPSVCKDIAALYRLWQLYNQRFEAEDCSFDSRKISNLVYYNGLTATELQVPNVPVPQRVRDAPKPSMIRKLLSSKRQSMKKSTPSANKYTSVTNTPLVAVRRGISACGAQRKRPLDNDDYFLPPVSKRIRPPPPASGFTPINTPLIAVHRASSPCSIRWKQPANDDDADFLPPTRKRYTAVSRDHMLSSALPPSVYMANAALPARYEWPHSGLTNDDQFRNSEQRGILLSDDLGKEDLRYPA